MNLILQLQGLDDLIVKHTSPPATTILRSKLHTIQEHLEAYITAKEQEAADVVKLKQAHTDLQAKHLALEAEHTKLKPPQPAETPHGRMSGSQPRIRGRMET